MPPRRPPSTAGQHQSLGRGRDRPGVGHIVAEVRAMIDAGDDEIELLARQIGNTPHGQKDAVGGRAVDAEDTLLVPADPQRTVQRQGTAGPALLPLGRHDRPRRAARASGAEPQGLRHGRRRHW